MPIVIFLGKNVKEYEEKSAAIIKAAISAGNLICTLCLSLMKIHSNYDRGIKETGEVITITIVWCSACKKYHALLPDFLLPHKHYSGNEIEGVMIESGTTPVSQIDTCASESTVRRWIKHVGESVKGAVGKLKLRFGSGGRAVSEVAIDAGSVYDELQQILEMAPSAIECSGNRLGLANLWLGTEALAGYV